VLSRLGGPGGTAVPATALVLASTNQVTHGFTSRPSTSTSTGAFGVDEPSSSDNETSRPASLCAKPKSSLTCTVTPR
jgi:hypothetical protein